MMTLRNPWQNSYTIRFIAAIDMALPCLLIFIYLQKFMQPIHTSNTTEEIYRFPSLKLFLLGPIIFNAFQIVVAYNLLTAAGRRSEPIIAYAKANTWFQFSSLMLFFLTIKLFLVLWFSPQGSISRRDIFGVSLIVLEIVFKVFGLFIVKEFTDDLRQIMNMFPTPQFYCIYNTPLPPNTSATTTTSVINTSNPPTLCPFPPCVNTSFLQTCTTPQNQSTRAPTPNQYRNSTLFTVV